MASTKTITLEYGAISVKLEYVQAQSAYPTEQKNFTEHILENNTRVRDDSGTPKRRWELMHDVPLTSPKTTALTALYALNKPLSLTENFTESGTVYTVHFEMMQKRLESPLGSARYQLVIQEL